MRQNAPPASPPPTGEAVFVRPRFFAPAEAFSKARRISGIGAAWRAKAATGDAWCAESQSRKDDSQRYCNHSCIKLDVPAWSGVGTPPAFPAKGRGSSEIGRQTWGASSLGPCGGKVLDGAQNTDRQGASEGSRVASEHGSLESVLRFLLRMHLEAARRIVRGCTCEMPAGSLELHIP